MLLKFMIQKISNIHTKSMKITVELLKQMTIVVREIVKFPSCIFYVKMYILLDK